MFLSRQSLSGGRTEKRGIRRRLKRRPPGAGGADARAFLSELRCHYQKARTIRLLLDRAPAHTDTQTLRLAVEFGIELVWLPKQWPERNAMDHLWKELKRLIAANRQAASIDDLVEQATEWVLQLRPPEALRKAGILSSTFWLRGVRQNFWLPT
jgi:transposase